jgi:long-chain fatty acid transport protein
MHDEGLRPMPLPRLSPRASRTAVAATLASAWPLMLVWPTAALAGEAYFQNGIGARHKALAGAGAASSMDATAVSLNPAGLATVDSQANIALSVIYLDGGFTTWGAGGFDPPGSHDSSAHWAYVPNLAATWRVDWGLVDAIALSVYGNGGVNTHYKNIANPTCGLTGVFCAGPAGIKLSQTFVSVALAKQVAPGISLGVAPIVARQTGELDGVSLFSLFSSDPANFSNRGRDESWGGGVRAGVEWKVLPGVTLGVAGTSRIAMSAFDKYRGLLAEHGDFDIPASVQAGVAVALTPGLTLMVDYRHIWFNSIASVGNASTLLGTIPAGLPNGPGFGVRDVDTVKIGLEWRHSPWLTLRAGYSYNTQPHPSRDVDLNIMTLGVVQHHISGGLQYKLTDRWDVELAAMYAPRTSVSGPELLNPFRTVEIEMSQFEFTVGAVYRFASPEPVFLK